MNLEIGDILLTRHADETKNVTPGHWNHAAMYVGNNTIVEAQEGPNAVLTVDWSTFYYRYGEILVLRSYYSMAIRNKMADCARQLIGSTYRKFASVFRFLRSTQRGENCVSVVRKAVKQATGRDFNWKKPDDIFNDQNFQLIMQK